MQHTVKSLEHFEANIGERVANGLQVFFNTFAQKDSRPIVVRAPGRAEGIGGHTDYNRLDSVGICIGQSTLAFMRRANTPGLRIFSQNFPADGVVDINIDDYSADLKLRWPVYAVAVIREMRKSFPQIGACGLEIFVESTVPLTGGVSSSASFELAIAQGVCELFDIDAKPMQLAVLCQRAENSDLVKSPCGLLDQATIALGGIAHLRFGKDPFDADFASQLAVDFTSIPAEFIVSVDRHSKRDLGSSGYPVRRAICEAGLSVLKATFPETQIDSYMDFSESAIRDSRSRVIAAAVQIFSSAIEQKSFKLNRSRFPFLGDLTAHALQCKIDLMREANVSWQQTVENLALLVPNRILHILGEHRRVADFLDALIQQDVSSIGKLFIESGRSGLDNYELDEGCPGLTTLVRAGRGEISIPGTTKTLLDSGNLGTRNMGGGHSANAISFVKRGCVEEFKRDLQSIYTSIHGSGNELDFITFKPAPGVATVKYDL
jgi:galactokinase